MQFKKIFLCALLVFLLIGSVSSVKRVLFYETKASFKTDTQYSKFKEELERRGYIVSKLEIELSKEILERNNPDVLVLPGLSSSLTPTEKAAVFEYVMQKGKGLFICGGTPPANELSIPFGMTIDEAPLEDETDAIENDKEKFSLSYADNFVSNPSTKAILQGVAQLGFFGGSGIALSGSAKPVIIGDRDTYAPKSPTGMFPKGSKPPIAAAAIVGNGLVFLLSDGDMLSNTYLDKYPSYDNLKFGANIVDWLSISMKATENASLDDLRVMIGNIQQENSRLNETISSLKKEKEELIKEKQRLTSELEIANEKIKEMEKQSFFGVKYWIWALVLIGVGILVLSIVVAKKVKKIPRKFSQLGYEFGKKEKEKEEGKEEEPLEIGGGRFDEDFLEEEVEEEEKG